MRGARRTKTFDSQKSMDGETLRNHSWTQQSKATRCEDELQVGYNWWHLNHLIKNRPSRHQATTIVPYHTLTLTMSNQWAFMGSSFDSFCIPKSFRFGAASHVQTWLRSHNAGGEWKLQICEDARHLQNLFLQTCCAELCALQERLSRTQNRVAQDTNMHFLFLHIDEVMTDESTLPKPFSFVCFRFSCPRHFWFDSLLLILISIFSSFSFLNPLLFFSQREFPDLSRRVECKVGTRRLVSKGFTQKAGVPKECFEMNLNW